ncbi:NAD(P)-dependent oxidoreductase [Pantoea sp. USHLN256]|uniref:NAD(P)-dependent oxidoreductase n=1 Tax=Pantoea sp. USHLN256 TaxID=3081293 RepID=UPI00301776C2
MNITFIGFGEAGGILAHDLQAQGNSVTVWDRKALEAENLPALRQKAQHSGVRLANSLAEALQDAALVFSTVTASQALNVAQQAAALLHNGQHFLDLNSVAPHTKRVAAEVISASDASYVDVAVMAPVPPKRLATPLLIGGVQAAQVQPLLQQLGCNSRLLGCEVGEASAIKMCRSVMIKGLEALTTECLSAARQYGVEEAVLDSLHASFPSLGWNDQLPHYLISRVAEHGQRRAEEMQEVVKTLQDVNVPAAMSAAIVATQQGLIDALNARSLRYQQLTPFIWQETLDKIYSPQ